jgi:hypothetical protein
MLSWWPLGCATTNAVLQSAPDPVRELAETEEYEEGYLCPMHPDHTSHEPGKCPRCGMALVRGALYDMRDYRLEMETIPAVPKAGEKLTVMFNVFHPCPGANPRCAVGEDGAGRIRDLPITSKNRLHRSYRQYRGIRRDYLRPTECGSALPPF